MYMYNFVWAGVSLVRISFIFLGPESPGLQYIYLTYLIYFSRYTYEIESTSSLNVRVGLNDFASAHTLLLFKLLSTTYHNIYLTKCLR